MNVKHNATSLTVALNVGRSPIISHPQQPSCATGSGTWSESIAGLSTNSATLSSLPISESRW